MKNLFAISLQLLSNIFWLVFFTHKKEPQSIEKGYFTEPFGEKKIGTTGFLINLIMFGSRIIIYL